jgi:2-hydroxy-3-keto-5-methylthiopentenyl-1-phosphate phosphatase
MTRASTPPILPATGPPVSFLVDYDGTISSRDVGDELMGRFVADRETVAAKDADYDAGLVGSRELMQWDMEVLPRDADLLRTTAASLPHDTTFPGFVAAIQTRGAAVEIVSDGLGFYVASNLRRLAPGLAELPIATNENQVAGPDGMAFPYGHPACFVCGTCKRERVRAHQVGGRVVVFIGDGTSDRYAAHHADVVFAKGPLAGWCAEVGHPFTAWTSFEEITAWAVGAFASGALPSHLDDLDAWHRVHGRPPRDFVCGPEVWGPGRTVPATLTERP